MAGVLELERLLVRIVADATGFDRQMSGVTKTLNTVSQAAAKAGMVMTAGLTAPITAFATLSVKSFADFDQAMTQSVSIMSGVTSEIRAQMEETAKSLSGRSAKAPEELAKSYYFLASAGMDAAQSMAALPAVSQFSTAGAFDMARATDLLTDAQTAMGMSSKNAQENLSNMVQLSDAIVLGAKQANASVEQFGTSLTKDAAVAARGFGMELSTLMGVLSGYAAQGIKAEESGNMMGRATRLLTGAYRSNRKEFERLNIQVIDKATGGYRNFIDIVADMEKAFAGMPGPMRDANLQLMGFEALAQKAILPLIGMSGSMKEWEKAQESAAGTTANVAMKQMESFTNQMMILKNQITIVRIEIGKFLAPYILALNEHVKQAIGWWQGLTDTQKKYVLAVAATMAAAGPMLLLFAKFTSTLGLATIGIKALSGSLALMKAGGLVAMLPFIKIIAVLAAVTLAITGLVFLLKNGFVESWNMVSAAVAKIPDLFSKLTQNAMVAISTIMRMLMALTGWLVNQLPLIFQKLAVDFAISIAGWAQKGLPIITAFVLDANAIFQSFSKAVFTIFLDLLTSLGSMFNRLGPVLRDMLKSILTLDSQDFAKATMQIGIELAKEFNTVSSAASVEFAKATQNIGTNVATAMDQLQKDYIRGATSGDIMGTLGDIWQEGAANFVPLWETNTAAIAEAADVAGGSIGGVVDSVVALQEQVAKPLQIAGVEGIAASSAEAVRMIAMAQMGAGTAIEAATRAVTAGGGGGSSIAVSRTEGEMVVTPRANPAMKNDKSQYESKVLEYLRQLVENTGGGDGEAQTITIKPANL